MSTFDDTTPDDFPLDLEAVTADDALVERLRHALSPDSAVVWDDNDDEDPGYALLRAVQLDVSADMPDDAIVPAEVTRLLPRRRHLSRGATIAVVAAGVLSIGGVAAASAPGQPLAGVRHAVSDAVATAVDAITPDSPVGPSVAEPSAAAAEPTVKPTPPGDAVSDAARSAAAVLQIEANLDRAEALMADGRYVAVQPQLDAAARKLDYVTDNDTRSRLLTRLALLQAQLDTAPTTAPSHGPRDDKGKPAGSADTRGQGKSTPASRAPTAPPAQSNRTQSSRLNNGTTVSTLHAHLPGDAAGVGGRGNSDRR